MGTQTPTGLERKYAALRAIRYEGSEQHWIDQKVDFAIRVGIDPWKGFQTASTTPPGQVRSNRDRTFDVRYWSENGMHRCKEITGVLNGKQLAEDLARKLNQELRKRLNQLIIAGTARPKNMQGVRIADLLKDSAATPPMHHKEIR